VCAGLLSRGSLGEGLNGLVRRVKRELLREETFLQNPACDIGFAELELMSGSARDSAELRPSAPGQLVIELLPCVNSYYRSPRSEVTVDAASEEMVPALNDLTNLLDRTRDSITRFRRAAGIPESRFLDREKKRKVGR
jgi:hypothetical protein